MLKILLNSIINYFWIIIKGINVKVYNLIIRISSRFHQDLIDLCVFMEKMWPTRAK
jgi:hypothetical protein